MSTTTVELELGRDVAPEGCGDCAQRLRGALGEHDGVRDVAAVGDRLVVELDAERCSRDCLMRAWADARGDLGERFDHTVLTVDGMDCASCARTVTAAIGRLPSVSGVEVSFTTGRMLVEHPPAAFDRPAVEKRVAQLGYRVRRESGALGVAGAGGMGALGVGVGGAGAAGANAGAAGADASGAGVAGANAGAAGADASGAGVAGAGAGADASGADAIGAGRPLARLAARLRALRLPDLLTLTATALLLVAVVLDLATTFPAAWLYGAAVAVGIGPIARSGLVALWTTRRPEIKFLMTIAAVGAIAIGAWMEAALVVVLFAIGEWLEGRAVARARRELESLVTLAPQTARLRAADGEEREVAVAALAIGDLVVVRPGERLPADGTVAEGRSAVDQAAITGESVPVDKEPGDHVFAGTLNAQGLLVVRVESAPGDTTLARIGRLVAEAQARRAPSERWVDAFARVYTPAVIAVAALVAVVPPLAWGATWDGSFYSALALLILACPCALVLSTPVTIVSALGRASAAGVLVKGGEHLERAAAIRTVAFDKTGTLTAGRPRVVAVAPAADAGPAARADGEPSGATDGAHRSASAAAALPLAAAEPASACADGCCASESAAGAEPSTAADDLLATAAALEQGSEHPLAAAIVAAARERGLALAPVEEFTARPGFGASARVGGADVVVGKPGLFSDTVRDALAAPLEAAAAAGQTAVVVTRDGAPLGVIGLADPPRPEAAEATAQLARLGVRTAMISGDNAAAARTVAASVGIDDVRADALPADKARVVGELGDEVAMVGDGVNDAPALAAAALGVAMGSAGSDTAIEVSDVALMGDDPRKVAGLIGLARWTRATVRANIAFSLGTKLIAALFLAAGMLPLWAAVASDVGASLVVVAWGLRVLVASPRGRMAGAPLLERPRRAVAARTAVAPAAGAAHAHGDSAHDLSATASHRHDDSCCGA
ncbi:heavy metal translocating P-type ATPase [Conexibacter arvalis]|uniref:Cd2+/Zn2+-exporting ATPase n=1 Tax=Conexibacter arvalis TaxID=912552 RepID=A0A840ICF4_9ACTN|nr:cation-translocating P-type ATPase [Conexibacter arvalis]MBB4661883.1 Cd2+/Zn2+-exporting ATPase [Conexibacter arvalis]